MSEENIVEDTDLMEAAATPDVDPIDDTQVEPEQEQEAAATLEVSDVNADDPVKPRIDISEEVVDYKKRYDDSQSYIGKLNAEKLRLENEAKQYRNLGDPQTIAQQLQAQREQAERSQLKPWNPRHPEQGKFNAIRQKAENFRSFTRNMPQEQVAQLAAEQFSPEEQRSLQEWQAHQAETQRALSEDPQGYIQNLVQDQIQSALSDFETYQGTRMQVDQFLNQNEDLLSKYGNEFMSVLSDQTPRRELATKHVALLAEVEALKAQLGKSLESGAHAEAQSSAFKQKATVKRDLNTNKTYVDPLIKAQELGLKGVARLKFLEANQKAS